jgi:hypothetical protein
MFARKLRLNLIMAIASSATVFYLGCGDDDDGNQTPSNKGGASSSTGGKGGTGGTGGTTNKGGGSSTGGSDTGGTTSEGGSAGTPQGGGTTEGGGAGAPQGGSAQGGGGGAPQGGGNGGEGGGVLPDCDELNDAMPRCYEACTPTTSEQIMNTCAEGVDCTPFDNSTLTGLDPNGELPMPIP